MLATAQNFLVATQKYHGNHLKHHSNLTTKNYSKATW